MILILSGDKGGLLEYLLWIGLEVREHNGFLGAFGVFSEDAR